MIHVDGAYSANSQIIGCGGIISLYEGDIQEGFVCTMKGNASLAAELWGCIWELRRAWTPGYRLVQVLCDASQVIEGVYGADIELHEDMELFSILKELLNQNWMADIKLVECNENEGADLLARRNFSYGLGVHFLSKEDVAVLLQDGYTKVV